MLLWQIGEVLCASNGISMHRVQQLPACMNRKQASVCMRMCSLLFLTSIQTVMPLSGLAHTQRQLIARDASASIHTCAQCI